MIRLAVLALAALLFLLVSTSVYFGLMAWWSGQSRKRRLRGGREGRSVETVSAPRSGRWSRPYLHVSDLLLALGWRLKPAGFAACSLGMGLIGVVVGAAVFQSVRSVLTLLLMLSCMPYLALRMSLINRQMSTRLEFLPAVELFYQSYLVTGCRHIRIALQKTVEERRLPGEVQAVFDQLYRNLSVKGDDEGSLRRFSLSFGNMWAEYFGNILKIALEEGNNVSDNLQELISDMRKAQLANQVERHRMLEIRLANYTPVLFLAVFMGVNFKLNPAGSYQYYIVDAGGREMLLNAVLLLFGSFMMGLYLSRRKL
ncbi:type II secretion system F family protein [Cohnella hongkongensis]|uniref:Type II secretion system F family protein n=1 Tax=Cohnella hongkongensis TaxID=178337 RepID=A0ABV9FIT8_9BACL